MLVAGLQCSALLLKDTTVWLHNLKAAELIIIKFGFVRFLTIIDFVPEFVEAVPQCQCHIPLPAR